MPDTTLWQPVLSTTVVTRRDGALCVLTGKRRAEGNATHVNIASTPTMRIPNEEAAVLLSGGEPFFLDGVINPSRPFVSESLAPSVTVLPDSRDPLAAKVGSLLASKLGLGTALESTKGSIGRASIARCVAGFSYVGDRLAGDGAETIPLYEPLIMFGAVVSLEPEAAEQIPPETVSYSNLGWAPIGGYVHGVATRTLLEVIPGASPEDELEVCVRGLCNATSAAILSDPAEIQRHLTEEGVFPPL
ncbi:MAG TPA: hypothetical protein VLF71_00595 [Candidatus Saccharimonadales bacterium]|nr:hypothetical protein [Candidatus Saccharimonadales bacterium]